MRPYLTSFVAAVSVLTLAAAVDANPEVYARTVRATVLVFNLREDGAAVGSGAVIDRDRRLVVTNHHVVRDSKALAVVFPQFNQENQVIGDRTAYRDLPQLRRDRRLSKCRVVQTDPRRDLAVLQLEQLPDDARALSLAEKGARPGELLHSIGNPGISGGFWVYTQGRVRQVYQGRFATENAELEARVVESDSNVSPGDSGGSVVNDRGELVAIVQSIYTERQEGLVSRMSIFIEVSEVKAVLRRAPERPADLEQADENVPAKAR